MTNLAAIDDLATVFAAAEDWDVLELSAINESGFTTLTVNPTFDGSSDRNLLATNQSLGPGQSARIRLVVWVNPPEGPTVFTNSVQLSALSGNVVVTDLSMPGLNPDPNGNGDPKEDGEIGATVSIFSPYQTWVPIVTR